MEQINQKSEKEKYIAYCEGMRAFLMKRINLHFNYLTIIYILILPVLLILVYWAYKDKVITIPEVSLIAILAANLYFIVRFHRARYFDAVTERIKWHRYVESAHRISFLQELNCESSDPISGIIISNACVNLFPEYKTPKHFLHLHEDTEPLHTSISNSVKQKLNSF